MISCIIAQRLFPSPKNGHFDFIAVSNMLTLDPQWIYLNSAIWNENRPAVNAIRSRYLCAGYL